MAHLFVYCLEYVCSILMLFYGVDIQYIDVSKQIPGGLCMQSNRTQHNIYLRAVFILDQVSSLGHV